MTTYRKVALEAAEKAGKLLLVHYHKLKRSEIQRKSAFDRVTRADLEANKLILSTIKKSFPEHDFLSEETGFEDNPDIYRWVIDPLDGTTNYIIGNPLFCVAIALTCKQKILLSVQYAPALDELFIAEYGKGATMNGKKIKVSRVPSLRDSIVTLARSRYKQSRRRYVSIQRKLEGQVLNMRHFGSTALTLGYVAAGRVSGSMVVPPGIASWDILPGVLLVREAGGRVTDFEGKQWTLDSQGIVATNGRIHKKLLRKVS